ncbi:MAG: START domain-containing protein [Myxococcota bacterium]|nr:START domain-containing protein [Myxococcota bacterium]
MAEAPRAIRWESLTQKAFDGIDRGQAVVLRGSSLGPGLVLALVLAAGSVAASEIWEVKERDDDPEDGYVLYVNEGDADYPTYKLETQLPVPPDEALASLLVLLTSEDRVPAGQVRRVVRQSEEEVVVHTTIDMPAMVADRDVALRLTVSPATDDGRRRLTWRTTDEVPPPEEDVVRIPESTGFWEFSVDGPARSRAVYVTRSDLGGSIPAWVVNPMMRDQVAGDMQRLRQVIEERMKSVSAAPPE